MSSDFPVAVTGLGVVCAAGANVDEFLANLLSGVGGIGPLSGADFSLFEAPIGGEVSDAVLARELARLGVSTEKTERPVALGIVAADEALRRSGLDLTSYDSRRIGLVVAKCQADLARSAARYDHHRTMGEAADVVAKHLGADGPRILVSTACAAGTNAIGIARDKLRSGEADVVFAGGMEALSPHSYGGFLVLRALSGAPCAPYSRSAGMNLGEGAGFLVIERLDAAAARGARVLGEVLGYGLSADAHHITAPDPTGRGAAAAMERALSDAGLELSAVDYVNGHGTGTAANDQMERLLHRNLFGDPGVPMSSTKSFCGHTLGAAGAIEAVTSILAIDRQFVPPTLNAPEGEADWDYVPNVARRPAAVEVVLSNNYAFGGNNASIVFAKPGRPDRPTPATKLSGPVAVTGIGMVGGLGVGVAAWREALAQGRRVVGPMTDLGLPDQVGVAMPALVARPWASPGDWRQMSRLTRHALVAARLACADAALPNGKEERYATGLYLGTAYGPLHAGLTVELQDPRAIAPAQLPQATVNVPAGIVCQVLGLHGPTSTIASGDLSGTLALATAIDAIERGDVAACVVIAADELSAEMFAAGRRRGLLSTDGQPRPYDPEREGVVMGENAVALVVEPVERAIDRGARCYAEIRSVRQGSESADGLALDPTRTRWPAVLHDAFHSAGIGPHEVQFCSGAGSGGRSDDAELDMLTRTFPGDVLVGTPLALAGYCAAASGFVSLAVAALAVGAGSAPLPVTTVAQLSGDRASAAAQARHPDARAVDVAVALDVGFGASYGATILTSPEVSA